MISRCRLKNGLYLSRSPQGAINASSSVCFNLRSTSCQRNGLLVFWGDAFRTQNALIASFFRLLRVLTLFRCPSTRHSCNPLALFDAEIEKYCPENYVDIKVCTTAKRHIAAFLKPGLWNLLGSLSATGCPNMPTRPQRGDWAGVLPQKLVQMKESHISSHS